MFRSTIFLVILMSSAWARADGTISGWVRPMGYSDPLYPVAVQVLDPLTGEAIPGLNTVNHEDGTYEITDIPEGDYKVFYDAIDEAKRHIDELTGNVQCDNGGCDRATLGSIIHVGSGTTTLNITLTDGMWLSGKVIDAARKPLPGVTVEFYDIEGNPYCCKRVTDDKGTYSRPVFWPTSYYVVARLDEPSSYQPQIYGGQPCSGCDVKATGSPILVEYGGRSGINFTLPRIEADPAIARESVDPTAFSGSWFTPDREGEGFIVEILDPPDPENKELTAVVFWFTFTPDGRQAWMVGSGKVNGSVAEVDFEITDGASFGADFDPKLVNRTSWGSLRLDFLNCNDAQAEFAGTFGSGQMKLTRLTSIDGLGCQVTANGGSGGNARVSGAWFNPAQDGQGFIVERIDASRVLAYWFTYDADGHQMWMLGIGELESDGMMARILMEQASGGRFGDAFDPASVVLDNWGEVSLQFISCDEASYSWEAPPPYGSGGYELMALTRLKGLSCEPAAESGDTP